MRIINVYWGVEQPLPSPNSHPQAVVPVENMWRVFLLTGVGGRLKLKYLSIILRLSSRLSDYLSSIIFWGKWPIRNNIFLQLPKQTLSSLCWHMTWQTTTSIFPIPVLEPERRSRRKKRQEGSLAENLT